MAEAGHEIGGRKPSPPFASPVPADGPGFVGRGREMAICAGGPHATVCARPAEPIRSAPYVFRRDGDYWTIRYEGAECRLRHSRGLAYLSILLERPGGEVHVADLMPAVLGSPANAGEPPDAGPHGSTRRDTGDAGGRIDLSAARSYRRRMVELREDLAEAESDQDLGRITARRAELAALAEQLSGSGNAGRRGSHAERARQAVTKAIGVALAKIREHLPARARHLDATVKRGYVCRYTPDPRRSIAWSTRR